jgi:hypothetical protein
MEYHDSYMEESHRMYESDMEDKIADLTEERDALARTLATLAEAGIVVGEDGAARWHGLTGAEIEGQREALQEIRAKAFEEDQYAWHHGVLEPGKPGWFWSVANDALAAASGRGAEGEAGE